MSTSDDRLRATFGALGRDNEGEMLAALRQLDRMLAERELDWGKVADMIALHHPQTNHTDESIAAAFTKVFDSPQFSRREDRPARMLAGARTLSGPRIPDVLAGRVEIQRRRTGQSGTTMRFLIHKQDLTYGPMRATLPTTFEALERAARDGRIVRVELRRRRLTGWIFGQEEVPTIRTATILP